MTRALTVELLAAGFDVTPGAPGSIALDGERKFKRRFTGLGKTTTLAAREGAHSIDTTDCSSQTDAGATGASADGDVSSQRADEHGSTKSLGTCSRAWCA